MMSKGLEGSSVVLPRAIPLVTLTPDPTSWPFSSVCSDHRERGSDVNSTVATLVRIRMLQQGGKAITDIKYRKGRPSSWTG